MNFKAPCSHFSATSRGIWSWGASEKWNDSWRSYDDKAEEWYQEYLKYKAQERQGPPDCCCYTFPCPTSEYDLAKRTSSTFGMFRDENRQTKLRKRGRNSWQRRYSRHSCQQRFVIHRLLKCSFCPVSRAATCWQEVRQCEPWWIHWIAEVNAERISTQIILKKWFVFPHFFMSIDNKMACFD